MRTCQPTDLSTRSDERALIPIDIEAWFGGEQQLEYVSLLNAEALEDTWRIIEAFSRHGNPFELEVQWAAGTGSGSKARVTVANATRVCVFARSLVVRVANLSVEENRVGVTIADGFAPSENQWEVTGFVDDITPAEIKIPPYARRLRVEVSDPDEAANTLVSLDDGLDVTRSSFVVADQPDSGVYVGGIHTVRLEIPANSTDFRIVFLLTL